MNNPVHQHYIPQSYLRNFAQKDGKLFFVDTVMRGEKQVKKLPTKAICAEKNIYTFSNNQPGDPFALEKFYAKEVDAIFPKIYPALVGSEIRQQIHLDTKKEILNTVLSLYFRRPQFLKDKIASLEFMFDRMTKGAGAGLGGEITYQFGGQQRTFQEEDLEHEFAKRKVELKEEWLIKHFEQWQAFVDYKLKCGIEVITVPDTTPLITSDNPVCIFDLNGNLNNANPFSPRNMIEIPLNSRKYLIIHPNETSEAEYSFLHQGNRDEYFANGVNHKVQENSDQRIIGYPGNLDKHFANSARLNALTLENLKAVDDIKLKFKYSLQLQIVINRNGGKIYNQDVAEKVKEIRKTGILNGERVFEEMVIELAKHGYLTV